MTEAPKSDPLDDAQKAAKHAYSVHQDQLVWSRVQTLIAVQTGTLAGTYYLGREPADFTAASLLTALGLFLTALLWVVVERDQLHREKSRIESDVPETKIDPRFPLCLTGGRIIRLVVLVLAYSDILVLLLVRNEQSVPWVSVFGLCLVLLIWCLANYWMQEEHDRLKRTRPKVDGQNH
jgi:hypothetical protein